MKITYVCIGMTVFYTLMNSLNTWPYTTISVYKSNFSNIEQQVKKSNMLITDGTHRIVGLNYNGVKLLLQNKRLFLSRSGAIEDPRKKKKISTN